MVAQLDIRIILLQNGVRSLRLAFTVGLAMCRLDAYWRNRMEAVAQAHAAHLGNAHQEGASMALFAGWVRPAPAIVELLV